MSIINSIPDFEGTKLAVPTAGIEPLLENDIRIDKLMQYSQEYVDIVVLDEISWGSDWWTSDIQGELSSSSAPEYPMAEVTVVAAKGDSDMISHLLDQLEDNHLPGSKSGPVMTSRNYLTMSSHGNREIPGEAEDESSSSA